MVRNWSEHGPTGLARRAVGGILKPALAAISVLAIVAACAPQMTRHGHLVAESDLRQIQPGMSREQVKLSLGTPDTTSTGGGGAYYYISSTSKQVAFMKPQTVNRRVVAVYFDQFGTVNRVANYGMKDGRVFDFVKRETPAQGGDSSFIGQIFRGIGRPNEGNLGKSGNIFGG